MFRPKFLVAKQCDVTALELYDVRSVKQEALRDRKEVAKDKLRNFKDTLPKKPSRALDLVAEKGASTWLTVIPLK